MLCLESKINHLVNSVEKSRSGLRRSMLRRSNVVKVLIAIGLQYLCVKIPFLNKYIYLYIIRVPKKISTCCTTMNQIFITKVK